MKHRLSDQIKFKANDFLETREEALFIKHKSMTAVISQHVKFLTEVTRGQSGRMNVCLAHWRLIMSLRVLSSFSEISR